MGKCTDFRIYRSKTGIENVQISTTKINITSREQREQDRIQAANDKIADMCLKIAEEPGCTALSFVNTRGRNNMSKQQIDNYYAEYLKKIKEDGLYEGLTMRTFRRYKQGEKGLTQEIAAYILGIGRTSFHSNYSRCEKNLVHYFQEGIICFNCLYCLKHKFL